MAEVPEPRVCPDCGYALGPLETVCARCQRYGPPRTCSICGERLAQGEDGVCRRCTARLGEEHAAQRREEAQRWRDEERRYRHFTDSRAEHVNLVGVVLCWIWCVVGAVAVVLGLASASSGSSGADAGGYVFGLGVGTILWGVWTRVTIYGLALVIEYLAKLDATLREREG